MRYPTDLTEDPKGLTPEALPNRGHVCPSLTRGSVGVPEAPYAVFRRAYWAPTGEGSLPSQLPAHHGQWEQEDLGWHDGTPYIGALTGPSVIAVALAQAQGDAGLGVGIPCVGGPVLRSVH